MDYLLTEGTLLTIALSKLLLVAFLGWAFIAAKYRWSAGKVALALTGFLVVFAGMILAPMETMFYWTAGDEQFVAAFLTQVMQGNPLQDFYYHDLPVFYPPLYFWVTGLVARVFAAWGLIAPNAIAGSKVGVMIVASLWFLLPYGFMKLAQKWSKQEDSKEESSTLIQNPWLWVLPPALFLLTIDFDSIILKPYETLPAILLTMFAGVIAYWFSQKSWKPAQWALLIAVGAGTFLSYYFWWFMLIPVLFALAFTSGKALKNSGRVVSVGIGMAVISSIYLVPFIYSLLTHQYENWQAYFFVPQDFSTVLPWGLSDPRALIYLVGAIGLILYRKDAFVKASGYIVIASYGYQFINILLFALGGHPLQASKPLLFLGTAALMVGASAVVINGFDYLKTKATKVQLVAAISAVILIISPTLPMLRLDNDGIRQYMDAGRNLQGVWYTSESLKAAVPELANLTWLSSGFPSLNAYIPMKYYIAHSPHFSHQASEYSVRMGHLEELIATEDSAQFTEKADSLGIDALLLYNAYDPDVYPIIFWKDNYPNGGEELQLTIPKNLVSTDDWELRYEDREWQVYTRVNDTVSSEN